jgi:glucokinase
MTGPGAVVAVDVGGTTLKGALVGADAEVLARLDAHTPAGAGGAAVTAAVVDLARRLATAQPGVVVRGVAAVTPGQVDGGVVRYAANLGWRDVPLAGELSRALGVPAAVDNDVWAAALAESVLGGRGSDCFFVALGTGIGGAHVRDGVVRGGATGAAGEVGHIPVYPDGALCGCGQVGCLEMYASAAGVLRRYRAAASAADPAGTGAGGISGAEAVVARLGRDPAADRVWAEAVEALALALATCTLLLDPGVVVLGGGLAGAGAALLDPLAARLAARLAWRSAPPLELSVLGNDAGWRGASLRAWAAADAGLLEAA